MKNSGIPMLVWLLLLATFLLVGCAGVEAPTPTPTSSEIPRISVEEVKARLDAGSNILIVDARSKAEYERESIAGAISIPLYDLFEKGAPLSPEEISQRYDYLHSYDEVITYCD